MKEIRDLCIFARQDVTRDPPFSRLDLISCRNLLIYLDEVAQRRVFQAFHFALRPHGILLIGPAESVGQSSELSSRSTRAIEFTGDGPALVRARRGRAEPHATLRTSSRRRAERPSRVEAESLPREADRWLLARYAPASLLVDDGSEYPAVSRPNGPLPRTRQRPTEPRFATHRPTRSCWSRYCPRSARPAKRVCRCAATSCIWTTSVT